MPQGVWKAILFAAGIALVSVVHECTQSRIQTNERLALLRRLQVVLPASEYDNNILDTARRTGARALDSAAPPVVYIARCGGEPTAAVFDVVTPDGYNGPIRLLIAISTNGVIAGVRVVSEHESAGVRDAIKIDKSDWILQFMGRSLKNPPTDAWGVTRDGGAFDQISGATITSRGVVDAIRRILLYFNAHKQALFTNPAAISRPSIQ